MEVLLRQSQAQFEVRLVAPVLNILLIKLFLYKTLTGLQLD